MHSSRMCTGRSLTVCWSLLPGGVYLVPGRGVYLVPGGGGVLSPGGVLKGVYLVWGVWPGVSDLEGGYLPQTRPPSQTHTPPPPWTEFLTHAYENITLATTSLRPVNILLASISKQRQNNFVSLITIQGRGFVSLTSKVQIRVEDQIHLPPLYGSG